MDAGNGSWRCRRGRCPNSTIVTSTVETPASTRQHWRRAIDARGIEHRRATERQRDAPGSAPELENVAGSIERETPPEWNVATAERTRVFPVVERRTRPIPARLPSRGFKIDRILSRDSARSREPEWWSELSVRRGVEIGPRVAQVRRGAVRLARCAVRRPPAGGISSSRSFCWASANGGQFCV